MRCLKTSKSSYKFRWPLVMASAIGILTAWAVIDPVSDERKIALAFAAGFIELVEVSAGHVAEVCIGDFIKGAGHPMILDHGLQNPDQVYVLVF
jgi:uncharacterized membrane protein SpoIIM required for sporulation